MFVYKDLWPCHLLLLCLLCAYQFFFPLERRFFNKGEPREAVIVQSIVSEGRWLLPLKPEGRVPAKPPLFHWLGALFSRAFGAVTEATVRFPSALFASLGVLAVYALGRKMFNSEIGFWAGVMLATSLDYVWLGISARVDMTLVFFISLALILFYLIEAGYLGKELWRVVFYSVLGVSVLAKGPVSIILIASVIALFLGWQNRWGRLREICFSRMSILTVAIVASWYGVAVLQGGENFFHRQIMNENLARFLVHGEGGTGHQKPIYYYLPYILLNGLPWSLFLPLVILDAIQQRRFAEKPQLFLMLWFLTIIVFISLSAGKRADYLLPIQPALALLTASWFGAEREWNTSERYGLRILGGIFLVVGVVNGGMLLDFFLEKRPLLASMEFLEAKNRDAWLTAQNVLEQRNIISLSSLLAITCLCLILARDLLRFRLRWVQSKLLLLALLIWLMAHQIVIPAVAEARSYASFMGQVKQLVQGKTLYLYGDDFDRNQVLFYHGKPIPVIAKAPELIEQVRSESEFAIMTEGSWSAIARLERNFQVPLAKSHGRGPDGNARLVLVQGQEPKIAQKTRE